MKQACEMQREREKENFLRSELLYQGRFLSFRSDFFKGNQEEPHRYDIVTHPGACAMIAVNHEGGIYLVKQWRHAVNQILLELPAGILEKGESPFECAQRELQEEIGFKSLRLQPMGGFFSAPGFCNEYLHLFLALELMPSSLSPDDEECIDVCLLSLEQALEAIETQQIQDAKTICGILRYERWLRTNSRGSL